MTRGFLPLLALVLAAGTGALGWATDGFRVVTSEGARRLAVERAAPLLPDVPLVDQTGTVFSLADYRGRTVLVDLIYTRCPTICGVLGDDLRAALDTGATGADLLSISIDPEHDDRRALEAYGARFGATAPRWRIARPQRQSGLAALLNGFGAEVIPDGNGGFIHAAAVYVVNPAGRLARIVDPDRATILREAAR